MNHGEFQAYPMWWAGDKRVEPFMERVSRALERNNIKGQAKTDIYNRAYEAVHAVFEMYDLINSKEK